MTDPTIPDLPPAGKPDRWIRVVAAWCLVVGCGAEGTRSRPDSEAGHAQPSDVVEGLWTAADRWSVSTEPSLEIGLLDGSSAYQFFDISAAARQSDGDIVLADAGSRVVRLYDADGGVQRTLGGAGSGPGEFQRPVQILIGDGDSISVWDAELLRVTRFDPEGDLENVRTIGWDAFASLAEPPLYPESVLMMWGGGLVVRFAEKPGGDGKSTKPGPPAAGTFRLRGAAFRISADGAVIDTLGFFDDVEQLTVDSPWGALAIAAPLGESTTVTVQPNAARVCWGDGAEARVSCVEDGLGQRVYAWPSAPRAAGADAGSIAGWRAEALELYSQKLTSDEARRFVDGIPLPETLPEHTGLVVDREGNLWIERGPAADDSEGWEHLVFRRDGQLLGSVALPRLRILEIGRDDLIGVAVDDLEVQRLVVFDIVKP